MSEKTSVHCNKDVYYERPNDELYSIECVLFENDVIDNFPHDTLAYRNFNQPASGTSPSDESIALQNSTFLV